MRQFKKIEEIVFGPAVDIEIPARVQQEITNQQYSSEKLIGWAQLLVLILFTVLYIFQPKKYLTPFFINPIPLILTTYFIICIVRLTLSYSRVILQWFLVLSIFADIALLFFLIWLFHIQYHLPAASYLKVPALMYIFIFIALRTLRFEPCYVILAGVMSAFGWFLMILYAFIVEPNASIAKNYLEYMTSNKILVGAEFDKIICILLTTGILAISLVRGKRMMMNAISKTIAAADLSRFFAPELAQSITHTNTKLQPGYGEKCIAAILHCDIRGFTSFAAQHDPTEAIELLTQYQHKMLKHILEFDGSVDKYLGDGILVSFGILIKNKKFAENAFKAAEQMVITARKWSLEREEKGLTPVHIGVAIAVGEVIFGVVGDSKRLEYTIIGDPVNLVAKLDKQCKVEHAEILAPVTSLEAAQNQGYESPFSIEKINAAKVEGVDKPLDLVKIILGY